MDTLTFWFLQQNRLFALQLLGITRLPGIVSQSSSILYCLASVLSLVVIRQHSLFIFRRKFVKDNLLEGSSKRSKAINMLLGVAVGDSFGKGAKSKDSKIVQSFLDGTKMHGTKLKSDHEFKSLQMTMGLCRFLVFHCRTLQFVASSELLIEFWVEEYRRIDTWATMIWRPFLNTRRDSYMEYELGRRSLGDIRQSNAEEAEHFLGNGAVLRCLPLAFVDDEQVTIRLARVNANATDPHVKVRAASLVMILAARLFLFDRTLSQETILIVALERFVRVCKEHPDQFDEETFDYLQAVDALGDYHETGRLPLEDLRATAKNESALPAPARGLDSDAVGTVGCVLYLLKFHRNHRESVLNALYMGGDANSIAGLVLGLVCGRYGLMFSTSSTSASNSLPLFVANELEDLKYVLQVGQQFAEQYEH